MNLQVAQEFLWSSDRCNTFGITSRYVETTLVLAVLVTLPVRVSCRRKLCSSQWEKSNFLWTKF